MSMNEYGEIIRNSSSPPPIGGGNGGNNNPHNFIYLIIGILVICAILWFVIGLSEDNSKDYNQTDIEASSNQSGNADIDCEDDESVDVKDDESKDDSENVVTPSSIDLTSIEPYYKGGGVEIFQHEVVDSLGDKYWNGLRGYMDPEDSQYTDCYFLWNIDQKYSELTATGIIASNDLNSDCSGSYKIYGDDVLLYSKNGITAETKPYDISVNISGVKVLKIEMFGNGNIGNNGISSYLCEVMLHK